MPPEQPTVTETQTDAPWLGKAAFIPGLKILRHEPLAPHTTMGVGGQARWFIEVDRIDALEPLLAAIRPYPRQRWMMLGGGSNTIFDDAGYDGIVIHLGREFRSMEEGSEPHTIRAGAGATLGALMVFAKRRLLAGLEFGVGIPGNLGGALAGNAGAGGLDICSITDSVEVIDGEGRRVTRRRGEFEFAYRTSALRRDVILAATLHLCPDTLENIEKRIAQHLSKRWEQPVGSRSSGCMFKNPPGNAAGRLIDQTDLKGLRVGGASVSEQHANFMVNDGTATTADILLLMEEVRERVRSATGIDLEGEVRVVPPN